MIMAEDFRFPGLGGLVMPNKIEITSLHRYFGNVPNNGMFEAGGGEELNFWRGLSLYRESFAFR